MGNYSHTIISKVMPSRTDTVSTLKNKIKWVSEYKYDASLMTYLLSGAKFLKLIPTILYDEKQYPCILSDANQGIELFRQVYEILVKSDMHVSQKEFDKTMKDFQRFSPKFVITDVNDLAFMITSDLSKVIKENKKYLKQWVKMCNRLKKEIKRSNEKEVVKIIDNYFEIDQIELYPLD